MDEYELKLPVERSLECLGKGFTFLARMVDEEAVMVKCGSMA